MRRIVATVLLFALAAPLAGCIIAAPDPYYGYHSPHWCYYHPGACR